VLAPPPVLFLAAWTTAAALHRIVPLPIARLDAKRRRVLGGALIATGACLSSMVVRRFAQASTPVSPLRETRALVTDGPYRYSRNPDYLGQALIYAGASIASRRGWPLVLLPPLLALITRTVIAREERYLQRRFGMAYRVYAGGVPRWL
jgi:protein-S-isoprenylcysteine O-methyltransferase Ste14